jgi:hypothetical protein
MSKNKKPNTIKAPAETKQPRANAQNIPSPLSPLWSFRRIDIDGPWCFTKISRDHLREVLERLKNVETMNWADLRSGGSHPVDVDQFAKDAKDRLTALKLDDLDELYSLRVSGEARVWAIKDENVLRLLWWDPNHKICPSPKK